MAAPHRLLVLNLGTQTVSVAEFKTAQNGGLILTNYRSVEVLADPALPDATRLAQAKLSIADLVGQMGYRGARINYAISSQAIFTRFVKLPSVGEVQVDQIVGFEAQQNVPYPIDEVVWDYQLVDSGDPSQVEVVIVAIKSDLLDEVNSAVEESGLRTQLVDVAPMALYNAYRYNYSDLSGCSLIIDIGARTTNLIFLEPNKVFSRSILNQGGNTITQNIAKDFNEPFGSSEKRKKEVGFVSLGGAYEDPDDPEVARVSKVVRNTMTRLHAEIARSISFYRAQQHGQAPARVLLCGGTASLPYMREFFHEKLQMPVEFFNPLRNVAVDSSKLNLEELSTHAHTLGELVGLALRNTSSCPMELNLRPASVVQRHRLAEQRPYLVLAGLCLLLTLGAFWLYFRQSATLTKNVVAKLEEKARPLKAVEREMSEARAAIKAQEELAQPYLKAVRERDYWAEIIDDINSRLPPDYIWITSFTVTEPKQQQGARPPARPTPTPRPVTPARGTRAAQAPPTDLGGVVIQLKGLYAVNPRSVQIVDDFIAKLKESTLYTVREGPGDLKRSAPNADFWGFDFSVPLVLKDPISLQ
ncbi:MAG: pilus assembly protein PilM [Verrucomicrobiota bacterium]|nr:pilus assembly protein PilM [Verrucomicrobiota bacterium]